jgi:hypothetical protein
MLNNKLQLVIFFCAGLALGLILNFNISAAENNQEVKKIMLSDELTQINMKLDAILANQDLMAKELKRIFARIH